MRNNEERTAYGDALEGRLDFHLDGDLEKEEARSWRTRLGEYEDYRFEKQVSQKEGLEWMVRTSRDKKEEAGVVVKLTRLGKLLPKHILGKTEEFIESLLREGEPKKYHLGEPMRERALEEDLKMVRDAIREKTKGKPGKRRDQREIGI